MSALLIAKQGLDYEINGAWKTAAVVFLAAWAVLAFAIYVSNVWDKRKPLMSVAWVLAGILFWGVWWAYLPSPPTQASQDAKTPSAGDSLPNPSATAPQPPPIYTMFLKHPVLADIEIVFSVPAIFTPLDVPIRVDSSTTVFPQANGRALVAYVRGAPERDEIACSSLIQMYPQIREKMKEVLRGSRVFDKNITIGDGLIIYHEGPLRFTKVGVLEAQAKTSKLSLRLIGPLGMIPAKSWSKRGS